MAMQRTVIMRARTQDEEADVPWQDNMAFEMSKQSIEDEWASVEEDGRITAATRDQYRDREYAIQPHTGKCKATTF